MPTELDIYRTATVIIRRFGGDAKLEAGIRADAMLDAGDLKGASTWRKVLRAIDDLQRTRRTDESVN